MNANRSVKKKVNFPFNRWIVCILVSVALHLVGLLAINVILHTTGNLNKARLENAEQRFYVLPNKELKLQPIKASPEPSPALSRPDKISAKQLSSAAQVKKSTLLTPQELATEKNLETSQRNTVVPFDLKHLKRYFNVAEVDQVALPIDDWNFSLNHLNPALTYTLQLEIYLSSEGSVDDWVVIKQDPDGDWVESVVEKLKSTVLIPASKDGLPVNMVRTIEIFIKP